MLTNNFILFGIFFSNFNRVIMLSNAVIQPLCVLFLSIIAGAKLHFGSAVTTLGGILSGENALSELKE